MHPSDLERLNHAVAEAADAWLNDPRDHEAYRRLVAAVQQRRLTHPTGTGIRAGTGKHRASVDADIDDTNAEDADTPQQAAVAPISRGMDPDDPQGTLRRLRGF